MELHHEIDTFVHIKLKIPQNIQIQITHTKFDIVEHEIGASMPHLNNDYLLCLSLTHPKSIYTTAHQTKSSHFFPTNKI